MYEKKREETTNLMQKVQEVSQTWSFCGDFIVANLQSKFEYGFYSNMDNFDLGSGAACQKVKEVKNERNVRVQYWDLERFCRFFNNEEENVLHLNEYLRVQNKFRKKREERRNEIRQNKEQEKWERELKRQKREKELKELELRE